MVLFVPGTSVIQHKDIHNCLLKVDNFQAFKQLITSLFTEDTVQGHI